MYTTIRAHQRTIRGRRVQIHPYTRSTRRKPASVLTRELPPQITTISKITAIIMTAGLMITLLVIFLREVSAQEIPPAPIIHTKVEEKIVLVKDESRPPILRKIAECESGDRHHARDGKVIRGKITPSDTGRYQINKAIHGKTAAKMGLNLDDEQDNETFAMWLFENQGSVPWRASSPCWLKK